MKNKILVSTILLFILFLLICMTSIKNTIDRPFNLNDDYIINVDKGNTFYGVLDTLKEEKIIDKSMIIKMYVKYNKLNLEIKPGKYTITKNMSLNEFINLLNKGNNDNTIKITVPEGYTIDEIAELLDKKGVVTKQEFIDSCKSYKLPDYIVKNQEQRYSLEGYLFPDTYIFEKNVTSDKIIETMLDRFEQVINEIKEENNIKLDKEQLDKVIIIASIVEKEIKVDEERPIAASVFYNRINKNMKLQSCATVLFALGYHKDKLYEKDLKVKSNYNTYLIDGLPPGPICSPGKKSILASVKPANTNYLFFVSNNDGTHFFTDDYNEFLKVKKDTQGF